MNEDQRTAAVEHVSQLLKRDLIALEDYRPIVDRILTTMTESELAAVLSTLPTAVPVARAPHDGDTLVIRCTAGVIKEQPRRLAAMTELHCDRGVMKVDLSWAELDDLDIDLDVSVDTGVLEVTFPRDVAIELVEQRAARGVIKNKLDPPDPLPGLPIVHLRLSNGGGVLKLRHPRRRRWFRRRR